VEERLQKILARAGVASRRAAETAMVEGRVTVNGETVKELGTKADPARDDIRVDGVRVQAPAAPVYLMLNKPKGYVSTRQDPAGRATVMELVPPIAGLFPVGRLDLTTEGLLLLTNDGAFAERVAHPRYEVPRVYHAKVHKVPDQDTMDRMRRGVTVEGERLVVDRVRILEAENNAWLEITLHEGKKHEVRRLLEAVGHRVAKLRRVALGPLTTRGLKPGEFRSLRPAEVRALMAPPGGRVATASTPDRHPGAARRPRVPLRRGAHPPGGARGAGVGARPGAASRPGTASRPGFPPRRGASRPPVVAARPGVPPRPRGPSPSARDRGRPRRGRT
jgi:23S rRNA pseudouridine2605 synthase